MKCPWSTYKGIMFSFNSERKLPFDFGCTPPFIFLRKVFLYNQIQYDLVHEDVHHTIIPIEKCFSDWGKALAGQSRMWFDVLGKQRCKAKNLNQVEIGYMDQFHPFAWRKRIHLMKIPGPKKWTWTCWNYKHVSGDMTSQRSPNKIDYSMNKFHSNLGALELKGCDNLVPLDESLSLRF